MIGLRVTGVGGVGATGKAYRVGTHRTRDPAVTVGELEPRMLEFGITRVADVTGLDCIGVPVFMAVRPNSRSVSVSQGKGVDRVSARASALMEAIEGWHAERVELALRYDSYASLRRRGAVVDVSRLPMVRGARLSASTPILWVQGRDLFSDELMWVPFECVSVNYVERGRAGGVFWASSNGLAAGNHVVEATVHAVCEVIERDAMAVWLAAGGRRRGGGLVDLATITDPEAVGVLAALASARAVAAVWDVTGDTGVATYACDLSERPDEPRWALRGVFGGQGCHLDSRVALVRALTEAIQSRLTQIAGSRDDMYCYEANIADARALASLAGRPAVPCCVRDLSGETFEQDIDVLVDGLANAGVDSAVVVDLSLKEVGVPVVKVVVPGLEPPADMPGYVPGPRAVRAMV